MKRFIPMLLTAFAVIGNGFADQSKPNATTQSAQLATATFAGGCFWCVEASYWAVAAMSIATIGIYGSRPTFWPMPSQFLTGAGAAAGIALINSEDARGRRSAPRSS